MLTSVARSLALAAPAAVSVPAVSARTALSRQASEHVDFGHRGGQLELGVFSNAARGRPNAVRWVTQSTVQSSAARTGASAIIAIDSRSGGRRTMRCAKPPPSRPSGLVADTRNVVEEQSGRVVQAGLV